jgi:hypothetical protein
MDFIESPLEFVYHPSMYNQFWKPSPILLKNCGSPDRAITPFAVTCGQRDHKFQKLGGM